MHRAHYPFTRIHATRYSFISEGKTPIVKIVEFSSSWKEGLYNLGFGDSKDGIILNDYAESNNGDIAKVLVTVIKIIMVFTEEFPTATIAFTGSTKQRTLLFNRILKKYYKLFSQQFTITGLVEAGGAVLEVAFDPTSSQEYLFYFVNRIN
jgi:hypothetical protein